MTVHATPDGALPTPDRSRDERGVQGEALGLSANAIDPRISDFALDRLSHVFESSAKRWELVVYPSLLAFIVLAAYGFYLVFSLTRDVHQLAYTVNTNLTAMTSDMKSISDNMGQISATVRSMSVNVDAMAHDMSTLGPMLTSIVNMDQSMQAMTHNTTVIRDDMSAMNHNIGRPMHFMNSFAPW
jgi:methyl-accepting chemotaxis protein